MANQTCGNCRYAKGWEMTKHTPPRINPGYSAKCTYEIPMPKIYPACIPVEQQRPPYRTSVWMSKTDCPCWEGK